MNDSYVEKVLTEAFLTLNEFSQIPYIKKDANGKLLNVSLPNVPFEPPKDGRYFILNFLVNEPSPSGLGTEAFNTWMGILQIDIMVPLGAGQDESVEKTKWLSRLFSRAKMFDKVMVTKCYRANYGAGTTSYITTIRVEWRASLEKD